MATPLFLDPFDQESYFFEGSTIELVFHRKREEFFMMSKLEANVKLELVIEDMYLYVNMYVHVYVYMYAHVYMYVYVYVYMYVHDCVYVYVYMCMHVYLHL